MGDVGSARYDFEGYWTYSTKLDIIIFLVDCNYLIQGDYEDYVGRVCLFVCLSVC